MPDPQPRYAQQFLERLLGMLSPRSASAEVIKADEGTRTITGEEDIAQFRAIVEQMMRQAIQQGPQPGVSPAQGREQEPERASESDVGDADEAETARRLTLPKAERDELADRDEAEDERDSKFEQERGYPPEDYRYWVEEMRRELARRQQAGDSPMPDTTVPWEASEVSRLHEERRILEQLMKQYQPRTSGQGQSYQALLDFWDRTMEDHRDMLDNYKARYPDRYEHDQQSTRGEIPTPLERSYQR